MTEETLVPLDESDLIAHDERLKQKVRDLETALAEKTAENEWLRKALEDIRKRAIRIRENKAVVIPEARFIEEIAQKALRGGR